MIDKQIIIDGIDVSGCECIIEDYYYQQANNLANGYKHIKNVCELGESGSEYYNLFCKDNHNCCYKQLKRKEQECEELNERTASIIYSLTGGRLSYSTYTLEGCEQAYHDQLEIDVERATKELQEVLQAKAKECKGLKEKVKELHQGWINCDKERNLQEANSEFRQRVINRYKQTLIEIIRFFEEDEKFARYSGRPIIFAKPALEKIEKILKENDIKIS